LYLAYLVEIGFLPKPAPKGGDAGVKALPQVKVGEEQREAMKKVGGRGGLA
jgi:L-aminoadipate-semialdehyde dehydrogenase